MSAQVDLGSIDSQFKALAKDADEAQRKNLIDHLRKLAISLESPQDSMQRIMYGGVPITLARVGCEIGLFEILAKSPGPVPIADLAKETKADPSLLARICRYLASEGQIRETDVNMFASTSISDTMATPGYKAGILHNHYMFPVWNQLPEALRANGYQSSWKAEQSPFEKAYSTKKGAFEYIATERPEWMAVVPSFMAIQRHGMPTWLDKYPVHEKIAALKPEQTFFVDVGGGIGHQAVALREKFPDVPNKIVDQDTPGVIENAPRHPGVEYQASDFFNPQEEKGAKIYYLRNVVHDWPDSDAIKILKAIMSAMGPDSAIFIDEMIIPAKNAHWQATQLDMTMFAVLQSIERTEEQWASLLKMAGLKIVSIHTYTTSLNDSIIECIPA